MVRTAGRLQTGALYIGTTLSKRRFGVPSRTGFAADRFQRPVRHNRSCSLGHARTAVWQPCGRGLT